VWTEFLYNFSNSTDYRVNAEPSLSVILTDVFSLKLAYLINYRNLPAVAGKKQLDTLYTTSLVAKL
jgi:putative salt-induced outer membrane protein